MSLTKRYLDLLPKEQQDEILGKADPDCEAQQDQEDQPGIRNFVSGDPDSDRVTRWLVENGILET